MSLKIQLPHFNNGVVFKVTLAKQTPASYMLYTINNNTCKKHKVKVYKFNVSTKQIYLQMSVNTYKPKQKVDERKMYMLRVYMLSDASFI